MPRVYGNDPSLLVDKLGRIYSKNRLPQRGKASEYRKEYKTWHRVVKCCTDPNHSLYYKYGAIGLKVSKEWLGSNGFINFLNHIGPSPSPSHTIDRINGKLGYLIGNVRWATWKEQQRNRKSNRLLTLAGETKCVTAWAEKLGMSKSVLLGRLRKGWSVKQTLTIPLGGSRYGKN